MTSSLIATLAMTLQIPLSMFLDVVLRGKIYPLNFYLGSIPMFLSLVFVSFLMKYDDCDPLMKFLKVLYRKFFWNCRRNNIVRWVIFNDIILLIKFWLFFNLLEYKTMNKMSHLLIIVMTIESVAGESKD